MRKHTFLVIFKFVLILLLINTFQPLAFAEELSAEESIWNRSYLTGNWGGLRSKLRDKGTTLNLEYTSSYQGLASGTGDDNYEYGGKFDAFINLDSGKLGLWEGGGLRTHLEYRHGEANAFRGGALWPVNSSQILPLGAKNEVVASSLYFTQKTSAKSSILFGKINVIDLLAADPFFGGWGNKRFMNVAFVAPPSGVLPPTIFGAITILKTSPVAWTFMLYDPNDRTTEYFPDDLFSDGVNISLSGTYPGVLAGRTTTYTAGVAYSTKHGSDLSEVLLPSDLRSGEKEGSYSVSLQFSHFIKESDDNPGDGWGVFIKGAIADGNPNIIKGSVSTGIGGKALFSSRPKDNFGFGYFYYAFSNDLQSAVSPLLDFNDEQGVEAFYSYAVTPWLKVTGDIQYIDPASGDNSNALVTGVRTNIRF